LNNSKADNSPYQEYSNKKTSFSVFKKSTKTFIEKLLTKNVSVSDSSKCTRKEEDNLSIGIVGHSFPNKRKSSPLTLEDFTLVNLLGNGSYGKIYLVASKSTKHFYAMKALRKDVLIDNDEVESLMCERNTCMLGNRNRFVVKLFCSFQNEVIINFNIY
jgi:hypothetical protein